MRWGTDRNLLEEVKAALRPDVDVGADEGGDTVKGVGHRQEVEAPHREELHVVGS